MTATDLPRMYTVKEVREVLHLENDKGVIRLIDSGELPAIKPNRMWLIHEDDLNAFLRGETFSQDGVAS